MFDWDRAPINEAAFGRLDRTGRHPGPPPIELEWREQCQNDGDFVFLWSADWNRRGTRLGWSWMWFNVGGGNDYAANPHPVVSTPAANVERMLSPLAHEARIKLMQAMYDGPRAAGELSEATGLKGGNLYYHLKELLHAAYVKEQNGGYDLTELGCQMLLTVAAIAGQVIKDSGEQGLLVAGQWER